MENLENALLIRTKEAAKLLNVSKNYLYRLAKEKKIKSYKPFGKLLYFDKKELIKVLKK